SDVWGPRRYDEAGHMIGLPGSYLHWRCPTLAEMRWQVWETFRSGAKGFISYTLAPEAPAAETATLPPPDVAWKNVLATNETDMGPNALTNPDGSTTVQLEELGRVFARVLPHTVLIRRWQRLSSSLMKTGPESAAQLFTDPETQRVFAVLVNDDLHQDQTITVHLGRKVTGLADLTLAQQIPLTPSFAGGRSTAHVRLSPGDGTILEILQDVQVKEWMMLKQRVE
ncbi:hypothetical protein ACFL6T_07285, partial [Candidatus Zixiibacteriota bacterium]